MHRAEEILTNVAWLINNFDDEALEAVQDIPFLEMAKAVTITPSPVTPAPSSRTRSEKRIPFWYSTIRKDGTRSTYDFHRLNGRLSCGDTIGRNEDLEGQGRENEQLIGVGDQTGRAGAPGCY